MSVSRRAGSDASTEQGCRRRRPQTLTSCLTAAGCPHAACCLAAQEKGGQTWSLTPPLVHARHAGSHAHKRRGIE